MNQVIKKEYILFIIAGTCAEPLGIAFNGTGSKIPDSSIIATSEFSSSGEPVHYLFPVIFAPRRGHGGTWFLSVPGCADKIRLLILPRDVLFKR